MTTRDLSSGRSQGRQTARQRARQQARRADARRREERAAQDRRFRRLLETVLMSLGERDDTVRRTEREAGQALVAITGDEGVSLHEAVEWCGGALSLREASRLRSLARQPKYRDASELG